MNNTEVTLVRVREDADIAAASALVWGFFDHLRERYNERHADIDAYIVAQDVADRLDAFAQHYNPPNGESVLARAGGVPAGIVMLKRVDPDLCEMNRLFVTDAARGLGLGRKLCDALLDVARDLEYTEMRLDAWDRHQEALPLYESLGFARYRAPELLPETMTYEIIQMRRAL